MPCIQNALNEEQDRAESLSPHRQSPGPKLTRDLLPSHRSGTDPNGHSMFNDLILPDDPLDGSRSLRKRKSSLDDERQAQREMRKKRRSSEFSRSEAGDSSSRWARASTALSTARSEIDSHRNGLDGDDAGLPSASEHGSTRLRSARARQPKPKRTDKRPLVWIEDNTGLPPPSLVIVFHLNNEKVQKIVTAKPKKKAVDPRLEARRERDRERRERNRRAAQQQQGQAESPEQSHYPAIQTHGLPFYGFPDKEMDETKNKPYGGILSEADADTSRTYPTQSDRKRFEDARLKAEEDWKQKQKQAATSVPQDTLKHHSKAGPPSKIKCISFGGWEIDTWHAAPYPEEYSRNRVLYICEFCLKYMNSDFVAWRHKVRKQSAHWRTYTHINNS